MTQKNRSSLSIIVAVVTIVILGVGIYLWKNADLAKTPTQQTPAQQPSKTVNLDQTIKEGYGFDDPEWEIFTSDIESQTKETVESFSLPKSPLDSDVIYVSISAGMNGEWPDAKSVNKIYSYNTKTAELLKLYEEEEPQILRTIGIEGTKLILMYDGIDNSPGPCFSVWADWDYYGYLDINNLNDQLNAYSVPAYQVKKGKKEQEKCLAKMDSQ